MSTRKANRDVSKKEEGRVTRSRGESNVVEKTPTKEREKVKSKKRDPVEPEAAAIKSKEPTAIKIVQISKP